MVVLLLALPSSLDMVWPSAGMAELSGIALPSRCPMGWMGRGLVMALAVSGTIFMGPSQLQKRGLCRLEEFGALLLRRLNRFRQLLSLWTTLMFLQAIVTMYLRGKEGGAIAGGDVGVQGGHGWPQWRVIRRVKFVAEGGGSNSKWCRRCGRSSCLGTRKG